jgi:probable rRNA maturation factor
MPPLHKRSEKLDDAAELPYSRIRVAVANETDAVVEAARLASAVELALADADCLTADVSLAIVDDETIHRINRQFLEHDYATDVLSFVLHEPPRLEGEIVASIDTARREADAVGWSPEDELLLYVVHGALHLAGRLDKYPEDAIEMRLAERRILERLGLSISPNDPRWSGAEFASPSGREARTS